MLVQIKVREIFDAHGTAQEDRQCRRMHRRQFAVATSQRTFARIETKASFLLFAVAAKTVRKKIAPPDPRVDV